MEYLNVPDLNEIVWALIDDKIFRVLGSWETQKQLIIQNITQLPVLVINNSNISQQYQVSYVRILINIF